MVSRWSGGTTARDADLKVITVTPNTPDYAFEPEPTRWQRRRVQFLFIFWSVLGAILFGPFALVEVLLRKIFRRPPKRNMGKKEGTTSLGRRGYLVTVQERVGPIGDATWRDQIMLAIQRETMHQNISYMLRMIDRVAQMMMTADDYLTFLR